MKNAGKGYEVAIHVVFMWRLLLYFNIPDWIKIIPRAAAFELGGEDYRSFRFLLSFRP